MVENLINGVGLFAEEYCGRPLEQALLDALGSVRDDRLIGLGLPRALLIGKPAGPCLYRTARMRAV